MEAFDANAIGPKNRGLSRHLIADFYPVMHGSGGWVRKTGAVSIKVPLTEADMSIALNWHSPFENSGIDSMAPTLAAAFQTGVVSDSLAAIGRLLPESMQSSLGDKLGLEDTARELRGRTGITTLNSMQVFSGMPPIKLSVTAIFRAWADPVAEVERPVSMLTKWALPVHLDKRSLAQRLAGSGNKQGLLNALFPSSSPVIVGCAYKRRLFAPMVIESVELPLSSPIDQDGYFVFMPVTMTLCSLTGIDRDDWDKYGSIL
jgi:hypothetical protein